jgi:predicted enzyme related to lactoylglutathione lyase
MSEQTNPANWFEIPVNDLTRAQKFYEKVFGFSFMPLTMGDAEMAMFPMNQGASGASGALIKTEGYVPSHAGSVVYLAVQDIEGTLGRVQQHGGKTIVPKMSIGEFGFIGQFEDSEGNRVAVHSMA